MYKKGRQVPHTGPRLESAAAMEVILKSRKRNHTSPPPSSTFTRSRAQSLLHRSRSGQIRHDPVRRKAEPHPVPVSVPVPVPAQVKLYHVPVHFSGNNAPQEFSDSEYKSLIQDICKEYCESDSDDKDLVKDLCKKAKLDDGDLACATAKDLRMRRVYSFLSSAGDCSDRIRSALSNGSDVDSDREAAELGFESAFADNRDARVDDGRISLTEVPVLGLSCEARDFNRGNTESSYESPKLQIHKQTDERNGDYCLEKVDDLGEEPVQTTPPDAVISIDLELNGDTRETEEALCVKDTPLAVNAEENSGKGFSGTKDCQLNSHVLKSKSVLKPRLPGKLFKAPGSVNYRRLMEFMGDDFGIPNSGHCIKDKKVMDAEGFEFPLASDTHKASKPETMTDNCTMLDTNGPKLPSSPMQLGIANVNGECLSGPSKDDECVSDSKADPAAGFLGASDVGIAKATNHNSCAPKQLDLLNKDYIPTTNDDEICDTSMLNEDLTESMSKDVCPKADKSNEPLKSKHVRRPYLHGKLIKTPGSVNYRRLLPFLNNPTKEDSGTSKFGDLTRDACLYSKELPLPSQNEEASIHMQMTVSAPLQDKVDSNALANNILVNPAKMLTCGNLPELTSSKDFSELPMKLDAKEMVHECLSESHVQAPSEKAAISSKEKCLSESKTDPCSVTMDFHFAKIVTNAANHDGLNQVHTTISEQHFSESQPKYQNLPYINDDVFNLPFKHHSNEEQGFTIGYDQSKELVNQVKWESVSSCPPEGQSLRQLDHNMLDVEENETSSHAISKNDDDMVLSCASISQEEPIPPSEKIISDKPELPDIAEENETNSCAIRKFDDAGVLSCVNISNEQPRPPSQKIISDKPELPNIAAHGGDTAGSLLNGLVYASKMPSKGSNNKNASSVREIENGSESKTTLVLNRCPRTKLFKHAGSFNYKRLLPIFFETLKSNSCASNNDYHPKVQKLLDHAPAVPISDSNLLVNPISASNDRVHMDDSTCDYGVPRETELHACDLNNDSSSLRSQLPDKQIVSNGLHKLEENLISSPISVPRDLLTTHLRPITDEVVTREEEATPVLCTEERSPETVGNCQSLSQLKVTDQVSAPTVGSQKGILRRNPRGCRGLCTCLNCASFRLHAGRAFEFSRNQMLDADEVAQDLMKELSHLRNILESNNDGVNDTPVFNGSQVKEACRKAFETEQLARDRLIQMNEDLKMHCRTPSLQPPSVKFSDHVEEKVIQPEA